MHARSLQANMERLHSRPDKTSTEEGKPGNELEPRPPTRNKETNKQGNEKKTEETENKQRSKDTQRKDNGTKEKDEEMKAKCTQRDDRDTKKAQDNIEETRERHIRHRDTNLLLCNMSAENTKKLFCGVIRLGFVQNMHD